MAVHQVTKADIQALINKTVLTEVIESAIKDSAVLPYMTRLDNMSSNVTQMSILDRLPIAYWQTGDTALKKTTSMAWKNKFLIAEELAVIVPFSINQLNDASVNIWGSVKGRIAEAFYKKIDQAILTGFDKPSHFRMSLLDSAINAGATVTRSENLRKDIINAEAYVLKSDYDPTTLIGSKDSKGQLRLALTDSIGQPIIDPELDALNKVYVSNGSWDSSKAVLMVGDLKQCVYAFRQDVSFDVFDTGVISDPETGIVELNLMQQDELAKVA